MENKVLVSDPIGELGGYELAWKDASLIFSINIKAGPLKVTTSVEVDSIEALDEIAKAVPGKIDDAIINVAKAALQSKKPEATPSA